MAPKVQYIEKASLIRRELLKCAAAQPMEFPTYTEFGKRVGIPHQGPWAPVLDTIALEEKNNGLPDITFLIVRRDTGYPGQIGFVRAKKPTLKQMERASVEVQRIIDKYNPGTPNPYAKP
jgi:hypothetical protein